MGGVGMWILLAAARESIPRVFVCLPSEANEGNETFYPPLASLHTGFHGFDFLASNGYAPGIEPQVLAHVSIYQSNPFCGYPVSDNHSQMHTVPAMINRVLSPESP